MISLASTLNFLRPCKTVTEKTHSQIGKTSVTRDRAKNGTMSDINIVQRHGGIGTVQPKYTIGLCNDCREWELIFLIKTIRGTRKVCMKCYGEYLHVRERNDRRRYP
jgi:hypothetical protein